MCAWLRRWTRESHRFTNWSSNIDNRQVEKYYVETDDEIIQWIQYAKDHGQIIRVAGSGHSISPVVCHSTEPHLILLSLEKFHLLGDDGSVCDLTVDAQEATITVNAGWTLGQLYNTLEQLAEGAPGARPPVGPSSCRYFLETQTASSAFTLGGLVCMPAHGSRLGGGLIADSVVALTLIDHNGQKITKSARTDSDFDLYRLSMGLWGVLTSVSFKVNRLDRITSTITTYNNIFVRPPSDNPGASIEFNANLFHDHYTRIIDQCLNPSNVSAYYHSFIDFHNENLLVIQWQADREPSTPASDGPPNPTTVTKINSVDVFLKDIDRNYRRSPAVLKILNQIARYSIQAEVESNSRGNQDMFWVDSAIDAYFVAYFIPVYRDGESQLDNLFQAIVSVKKTIEEFEQKHAFFNLDLPSDLRFVVSSDQAQLSPIYSTQKNVYAVLELVLGSANLEFDTSRSPIQCAMCATCKRAINRDFRQFIYQIEQQWLALGGVPHWAKLFGFAEPTGQPFAVTALTKLFPPEVKSQIRSMVQPLFVNQFISDVLSE